MVTNSLYRYLLQLKNVLKEKNLILATPNYNMLCNLGDVVDYNAQSLAAILKEITETTDLKFKVVFEKLSLNQYQIFILFENNFSPSETHKLKNLFILFRETAKDINQENFQSWLSSEKSYHIEKLFTEISTQFK